MKKLIYTVCIFACSSLFARDFTIIELPDTQNYTGRLDGGTPEIFKAQTQWIVDNKDSLNIVYIAHVGDLVQRGDNNGNDIEWLNADSAMSILEDSVSTGLADGIPYGIAVGNHDQSPEGDTDGSTFSYNQFFGVERFSGRDYYGGHFGSNNDNHFDFFSASGLDFIVIYLEYDVNPDVIVLTWADSLLKVYNDKRAISHYILNPELNGAFSPQGRAIYGALMANPNLFLMLSGHLFYSRREDTFNGNTVYSLTANYQVRENGGN